MLGPGWVNCLSFETPSECRLSSAAHWGVRSNCWLFFLQGRRAAYGVLCVTQTVNFHSFSVVSATLGLEGTGSLQFPPISLSYFPSLCFCPADSLSAALFCWEVNTWLGIEGDLAALIFFFAAYTRVAGTVISNLEIVLNVSILQVYANITHTHTHTHTLTPFHIMFINDCETILVHMD